MDTPTGWGGATHNEEQWIYEKRKDKGAWLSAGHAHKGAETLVGVASCGHAHGGEAPAIGNNEHVRKEGGVASRGHTHLRREPPHNAEH